MPIDVNLYIKHIDGAVYFRSWAATAYELLKAAGTVEKQWQEAFENSAAAKVATTGPILKALSSGFASQAASADHRRHDEIVARATYIYAWTGLEHLLGTCVEELCRWEPQRVIPHAEKRALQLLASVVKGERSQATLIEDLAQVERRNLGARSFEKQREYFAKTWDVVWEDEWYELLSPIAQRRNDAAHETVFEVPTVQAVADDLWRLRTIGQHIAARCLRVMGREEGDGA